MEEVSLHQGARWPKHGGRYLSPPQGEMVKTWRKASLSTYRGDGPPRACYPYKGVRWSRHGGEMVQTWGKAFLSIKGGDGPDIGGRQLSPSRGRWSRHGGRYLQGSHSFVLTKFKTISRLFPDLKSCLFQTMFYNLVTLYQLV